MYTGHVMLLVSKVKNSAGLTGHVIRVRETRNAYRILLRNHLEDVTLMGR
jgi:hypothetical protein